jgi:hypothetical protein
VTITESPVVQTDVACTVVIPARNEAGAIAGVVAGVPDDIGAEIIVVDNGSTDSTAEIARLAGARVVSEPIPGYGQACRAGVAAARATSVVVFIDGDGSMDPSEISALIAPVLDGTADIVCGSRRTRADRGTLGPHQRFGNALAVLLLRMLYGVRLTDLGPYRAVEVGLLRDLGIGGSRYAWVAELLARAARRGATINEIDVAYRHRSAGTSKVSGTIRGSIGAGAAIISTLIWTRLRPAGEMPLSPGRDGRRPGQFTPRGAIGAVVGVGAALPIAQYCWVVTHRIGYHFDLEWLEGGAVELVARVAHGHPLYTAPSLGNAPWPYPPLYFWLSGGVAKIVGVGYLAPRLVSVVASLGAMWLLAVIVRSETGSRSAGVVAAGLYAGAYHEAGDWYDLARVDSLFVCLTLLTLLLGRRATTVRAGAVVGIVGFLAFFTKQSAAAAIAFALVFILIRRPKVGTAAIAVAVALGGISTVVMDALTNGWYRYYVFEELPAQGISSHGALRFWTVTIWHDAHSLAVVGIALIVAAAGGWAGRSGRGAIGYWCAAGAGLFAASWLGRQHDGGYLDVLMPAFAALAIGGGLAWGWALAGPAGGGLHIPTAERTVVRWAAPAAVAAGIALGLSAWWYPTNRQIPTVADARAGNALLATIEQLPGRVVVLDHPWYADELGKGATGQAEAIRDIVRAGPSRARTVLEANLASDLSGVSALILDNTGDEIGMRGVIARDFQEVPLPWHPGRAFHEVDDLGLRPNLLFIRRSGSLR